MLKKFFISMLGTMAGLWLSFIIFMIVMIIGFGIMLADALSSGKSLAKSNILYIELKGDIPERQAEVDYTTLLTMGASSADNLADITNSLLLAAHDKKISGVYIDCCGSSLGIASRSEIVDAIKEFKKSGKWVYAYADSYTQGDYYIASVADQVYINPVGELDVRGVGSTAIFFKDLLDKIGVDVQIVKVGSFKSAVEPFIRNDMSEPSRLQTMVYVSQIWDEMSGQIAGARNVDTIAVKNWADSMCITWAPERYLDIKAVDKLMYRNQVEDALRMKMGLDAKDNLPLVRPSDYMALTDMIKSSSKSDHIAVLYAVGDITQDGTGGIASNRLVPEIERLAADDNVKALVLRVNSGGGSAFASEQIWNALENFKATGKPFYVSMGDYAASGGYYISCGADRIYSDPCTLTGSIGIFGMIPCAEKLFTDKLGVHFQTVATSPNAVFPSLYEKGTPAQLDAMQKYVERGYDTFTSRVAQGRNISVDSVKVIGEGRVWDGVSALNIGLVDQLGTLQDALVGISAQVGLDANDFVAYPALKDPWMQLLESQMGSNLELKVEGLNDAEVMEYLRIVRSLREMHPLQARMEKVIVQ